jgi:hypothetical protein
MKWFGKMVLGIALVALWIAVAISSFLFEIVGSDSSVLTEVLTIMASLFGLACLLFFVSHKFVRANPPNSRAPSGMTHSKDSRRR